MIGDSEEVEIPDLVEPIVAWRCFKVAGDSVTKYLASNNGTVWPPNGTGKRPQHDADFITATCTSLITKRILFESRPSAYDRPLDHPIPCPPSMAADHAGMGCGIYAFKDLEDMAVEFPLWGMIQSGSFAGLSEITIWGQVELWGKVYDHEKGYRAQHARIHKLFWVPGYGLPRTAVEEMGENYGVPVARLNPDMSSIEPKQRARMTKNVIVDPLQIGLIMVWAIGSVMIDGIYKWAEKRKDKFLGRNRKAREGNPSGGASTTEDGTDP